VWSPYQGRIKTNWSHAELKRLLQKNVLNFSKICLFFPKTGASLKKFFTFLTGTLQSSPSLIATDPWFVDGNSFTRKQKSKTKNSLNFLVSLFKERNLHLPIPIRSDPYIVILSQFIINQ